MKSTGKALQPLSGKKGLCGTVTILEINPLAPADAPFVLLLQLRVLFKDLPGIPPVADLSVSSGNFSLLRAMIPPPPPPPGPKQWQSP